MHLSDFDFDLPDDLIATRPASPRSSARLLLAQDGGIADRIVNELPDILRPTDRLVLNDTKVIPARLFGVRRRIGEAGPSEAKIEVTLLEPRADGTLVSYRYEVKVMGKVAAVGGRMLDRAAAMIIRQFFERLASQVGDSGGAGGAIWHRLRARLGKLLGARR